MGTPALARFARTRAGDISVRPREVADLHMDFEDPVSSSNGSPTSHMQLHGPEEITIESLQAKLMAPTQVFVGGNAAQEASPLSTPEKSPPSTDYSHGRANSQLSPARQINFNNNISTVGPSAFTPTSTSQSQPQNYEDFMHADELGIDYNEV